VVKLRDLLPDAKTVSGLKTSIANIDEGTTLQHLRAEL